MRRYTTGGVLAAAIALSLLVGPSALAHKPLSILGAPHAAAERALRVADPDLSQVAYAEITSSSPALWLSLDGKEGERLHLSLGLPVLEELRSHRPSLAVVGPGLPPATLPFALPVGAGALVFDASSPVFFHEPFTGTDSWILLEREVSLPATGSYSVVAYFPSGEGGKLWVAVGTREAFGLRDVLAIPAIAREVRAFHGLSGLPAWLEALRLAGLVLLIVASYALFAR